MHNYTRNESFIHKTDDTSVVVYSILPPIYLDAASRRKSKSFHFYRCMFNMMLQYTMQRPVRLDDTDQCKQKMNRNEGWRQIRTVPYSASWDTNGRRNPDSSRKVWATAAATAWWRQSPCRENQSRNNALQAYGSCYKHVTRLSTWFDIKSFVLKVMKPHGAPYKEMWFNATNIHCFSYFQTGWDIHLLLLIIPM